MQGYASKFLLLQVKQHDFRRIEVEPMFSRLVFTFSFFSGVLNTSSSGK
jgi:hypothetical protein